MCRLVRVRATARSLEQNRCSADLCRLGTEVGRGRQRRTWTRSIGFPAETTRKSCSSCSSSTRFVKEGGSRGRVPASLADPTLLLSSELMALMASPVRVRVARGVGVACVQIVILRRIPRMRTSCQRPRRQDLDRERTQSRSSRSRTSLLHAYVCMGRIAGQMRLSELGQHA
jgi:hypothetical protein